MNEKKLDKLNELWDQMQEAERLNAALESATGLEMLGVTIDANPPAYRFYCHPDVVPVILRVLKDHAKDDLAKLKQKFSAA